jgi:hypothetical protein
VGVDVEIEGYFGGGLRGKEKRGEKYLTKQKKYFILVEYKRGVTNAND